MDYDVKQDSYTFKRSFKATWRKRLYFFKHEHLKLINESNVMHDFQLEIKLGLRYNYNTLDSRTKGVMTGMGTSSTHAQPTLVT